MQGGPTTVNETSSDTETSPEPDDANALFLVGIGASAGGLEAIRDFVRNLPTDVPAAFVIVQHLSPDHQSLLTTLIGRETKLDVIEVKNGVVPETGKIYVTPPNSDVLVRGQRLVLERPNLHNASPKPSVDRFFRSAADSFGDHAVGIIFSGTGSDGSYGLQAIQSAGGIAIAQDDKSAKYDGMPISAVETGCVDIILPPDEVAREMKRILKLPRDLKQFTPVDLHDSPMDDLLQIVLTETHADFSEYKQTTVQRRIERRMTSVGVTSLRAYTNFCRANPGEITKLFKDLLISVTRFFRDPAEFEKLVPVINSIVQKSGERTLRIWIVGCATGEEVYSIAMLFGEAMGGPANLRKDRLQIFATDIDEAALTYARKGVYMRGSIMDIPPEYFGKYIHQRDGHVVVDQRLKDVTLFSNHNICQDPPFLNTDLICCRNLLIYFNNRLQERVLSRLNYALVPEGYLFLGKSETVSVSDGLFDPHDQQSHLFRKRSRAAISRSALSQQIGEAARLPQRLSKDQGPTPTAADQGMKMFDLLIGQIGPNSMLLTKDLQIVRIFGDVSRYSALTDRSRLKLDISILRPELSMEARSLAAIALKKGEIKKGSVRTLSGDEGHQVRLDCYPLDAPSMDEAFLLVVFNRWPVPVMRETPARVGIDEVAATQIDALEQEIARLQEEHQQTIEELETTNEELQTTIEEFQSTNEELQSTNEEIETSNEELQSTNEELITVNEELQISTYEMNLLNEEQAAVLESVVSPLLIVDVSMHVTKANSAAVKLMELKRPIDRPHLSQCKLPQGFPVLSEICNDAMNRGKPVIHDIVQSGSNVSLDVAPFFNSEGQLRGATLMFHWAPHGLAVSGRRDS